MRIPFLYKNRFQQSKDQFNNDREARGQGVSFDKRYYLYLLFIVFFVIYLFIIFTLVRLGLHGQPKVENFVPELRISAARPDIFDRNGILLATDIKTYSLYADPKRILDASETIELLSTVLRDLDWQATYNKLHKNADFVWIRRGLTPKQKAQIIALGIPALGFKEEIKRFYPAGATASHVLGYVNIDNKGLAGIEKYIDDSGLSDLRGLGLTQPDGLKPLYLSIDIRIQSIIHDILKESLKKYQALAAGAVLLNVKTGEVISLVSLPDFDPNAPADALKPDRLNRITGAAFELGSTIKSVTTAMALTSKKFTLDSMIDASQPLAAGGGKFIHDYYGKNRPLSVAEVFVYSSNIGSAKEAIAVGPAEHRAFWDKLGLLKKLDIALPEVASPVEPRPWRPINSMTIAFGHGLMTTPLQLAVASGALMNHGIMVSPTFFKRSVAEAKKYSKRVVEEDVSRDIRYLYRLNGKIGSARQAVVDGYRVGGKTGTAEKVENGKYIRNKRFNSFDAAFPMDDPQYILFTIIDEPKPLPGTHSATAAMNAAPITKEIIEKIAIFTGIVPDFDKEQAPVKYKN